MPSRISKIGIYVSIALLVALAVLIFTHSVSLENLFHLIAHIRPIWLLLMLVFQALTYVTLSTIWYTVTKAAGIKLERKQLLDLTLKKFAVDQLFPFANVAGIVATVKMMDELKVPVPVAAETLIIEMMSYYSTWGLMSLLAIPVLIFYHGPLFAIIILGFFVLAMLSIVWGIIWLVHHRTWEPPKWVSKFNIVGDIRKSLADISTDRIHSRKLFFKVNLLQILIVILDSSTLWAILASFGFTLTPLQAFIGFVIPQIGALLSLIPNGFFSYEAISIITLKIIGLPIEAAVTATLILRGMTFWIPLFIGFILYQRHLLFKSK